jgi:hypothetical protein
MFYYDKIKYMLYDDKNKYMFLAYCYCILIFLIYFIIV